MNFLMTEAALLHPFFFVGALCGPALPFGVDAATIPCLLSPFQHGCAAFLGYFILSWHSRILPNWIAPSVIPLFCLGAIYWWRLWLDGWHVLKRILIAGLVLGSVAVVILHEPNIVNKALAQEIARKIRHAAPRPRLEGTRETRR